MKKRPDTFKFRLSNDERQAIAALAKHLSRSQSDAVRFVVVEAAKQLAQTHPAPIIALPAQDPKQEHGGTHVPN